MLGRTGVHHRSKSAPQWSLESLRLSRARILDQLSRATNPAHRQMLESALQAINIKCAE